MAQSTDDVIETDAEAADVVADLGLGSRGLRRLASNAGVSRRRGDTIGQTAGRVVAQDPALAARLIENNRGVDATAFRERREVGRDEISLAEAARRARHERMGRRLRRLDRTVEALPSYAVRVRWEYDGEVTEDGYEPGVTSIVIKRGADWDGNGLAASMGHAILRSGGRACTLSVSGIGFRKDYAEGRRPRREWRMFAQRVERFYDPETRAGAEA